MANKKKYEKSVCILLSTLGYSLQDIADVYSVATNSPCSKSAISKILSDTNIKKSEVRVNPRMLKQQVINELQKRGLFLPLMELYKLKYTKPVRDTRFQWY